MRFPTLPLLLALLGTSFAARSVAQSCIPGPTTLCLNQGRFEVSVSWKDFSGATGAGQAVGLTGDAGAFWFFSAENLELVVKVLDGRGVNGAFWVFYGALSSVEYTIRVTDAETGATKSYFNPSGTLASEGDTGAFPSTVEAVGPFFHVDRTAFPAVAEDLKASFVYSPSSPAINSEVTFTDTSEGDPDLRCWNFGDGTGPCASSEPVATHTYSVGRTYLVSLLLRRFDNQTVTESKAFRNVTVTEEGSPCSYSLTPKASSFLAAGGTGKIVVSTSASDCKWTATSNSSFLTIQSGASGEGNGSVQYQVAENTGTNTRTGTLKVAGVTFTVTQQAKTCATLTPESATFEAAGGSGEITITAPGSCKWTAKSNSAFLIVDSGASGNGNGQVRYRVTANGAHTDRTGTLTVADKSFEVTQEGVPCSYTLTPDVTTFDFLGGVGAVNVTTDSDCSWQATSDAPFLQPADPGSRQGNGKVTFCVAANRDDERTAGLSIGGEIVPLTQSAHPGTPPSGCSPGSEALCVLDRFETLIRFRDSDGQSKTGKPVSLSSQSAYFTFFDSANIELIVKLLDGRAINDHYWFFYGSLSNLAYAVTLTDTATNAFQLYCNPAGAFQSIGDTSALPAE